jgi:putative endonuclease
MRTGQGGEDLALSHLEALGYRLVARNHRCARGEVDLIVERGALTVFVEVRTRMGRAGGSPLETVGVQKQRKVVSAARDWLARAGGGARELRFDVVGVVHGPRGPEVAHVPGAFDAGEDFAL